MALEFPTRAERPGHLPHSAGLEERSLWPEFLYHDPVLDRLLGPVIAEYAEFQFYAWDDERDEVVDGGMAVPAWWDGEAASLLDGGLDAVVEARFADGAPEPNVLCALQILIAPESRGQSLSSRMIRRMAENGRDHGLETLIAPVCLPSDERLGWAQCSGMTPEPCASTVSGGSRGPRSSGGSPAPVFRSDA